MPTTRFTELVGGEVPIWQAGMGAASPPGAGGRRLHAGEFDMVSTARWGACTVPALAALLDEVDA